MTVKIKKTYKYIKYLFGTYAFFALIGGFIKINNEKQEPDNHTGPIESIYTVEKVYADIPYTGDGSDAGSGCDGDGSSCS